MQYDKSQHPLKHKGYVVGEKGFVISVVLMIVLGVACMYLLRPEPDHSLENTHNIIITSTR